MRLLLLLICLLLPNFSYAVSSDWQREDEAQTRLIVGNVEQRDGKAILHAGIQHTIKENWKTYWRSGGDGGFPIELNWQGSSNLGGTPVQFWPAPHRKVAYGTLETYGYPDEVILPIEIPLADATQPTTLTVQARYAVCDELCVYLDQKFSVDVPANANDTEMQTLIDRFRAQVPQANGGHGITINAPMLTSPTAMTIAVSSATPFGEHVDMFLDGTLDFRFPQPKISLNAERTQATFAFTIEPLMKGRNLTDTTFHATLVDGEKAVEWRDIKAQMGGSVAVPAEPIDAPVQTSALGWGAVLLAAFLGGLILNIMPCVLPVLSLKILGVMSYGGAEKAKIRQSFFLSALGILSSFLLLALVVVAFKAAGSAVGWGFHFQHPGFVVFLILVLTLFAANQFGWFEVWLPYSVSGKLHGKLDRHHHTSPMGHFMTGAFATLLATPCSAPFLGTAVGFALSQGVVQIITVFLMMGVGLAAPYLLIMLFPALVKALPKPGAWMLKVKYLLAFGLLLTALWLLSVLYQQTGLWLSVAVGLLMLGILMAIRLKLLRHIMVPVQLGLAVLAVMLVPTANPQSVSSENTALHWVAFDETTIAQAVSEDKIVFVDVTADWCLTCKFNKANVVNRGAVLARLQQGDVITMKADYTKPSEEIRLFLEKHGRYGIPFNIVYGAAAKDGMVLPELLTSEDVLAAIEKAKK